MSDFYPDGELLKPAQARAILKVSPNTLRRMIRDHQVEAVDIRKPGGKYAILRIKADSLRNPTDPMERAALGQIKRGLGW